MIIGLACVWYFTAEGSDDPGWLGPHYTEEADPGTTDCPAARLVPTSSSTCSESSSGRTRSCSARSACRTSCSRSPSPFNSSTCAASGLSRRPVAIVAAIVVVLAMGTLTYKGATAKEALGSELVEAVPAWAEQQGFAGDEEAVAGAEIFAQAGCGQCHVYLGTGASNLGAPNLSDVGASDRGAEYFANYVSNPAQFGNNVMPPTRARAGRTSPSSAPSSTPPRARRSRTCVSSSA